MRRIPFLSLTAVVAQLFTVLACTDRAQVSKLEHEILVAQAQNKNLSEKLERLELQVLEYEVAHLTQLPPTALFSPASSGYQPVYTPSGVLYVSVEDIKPYANGFKIRFEVGNPMFATFQNVKALISWGGNKRQTASEPEPVGQVEHSFGKDLRPGTWTFANLVLSPATKEQLENIRVKIGASSASLRKTWPN